MSEKTSGGVGFFGALTLLFIYLKLAGHITWSWWWVLAPIWVPIVLFLLLAAFVMTIVNTDRR